MQVLFADLYTPYIPIPEGRGFTALFGNDDGAAVIYDAADVAA